MSRGRYSAVDNDDYNDDDAVDLILGRGRNDMGFVLLDDLDENGQTVRNRGYTQGQTKRERLLRKTPNNLLYVVAFVVALLVLGGIVFSPRRGAHRARQYPFPLTGLSNGTHLFNASTILISLDGFHPHYVSEERTPRLHGLVRSGAAVPYMKPSFPTQTFPNHWTLVTGLEPIHHGIVGNTFLDPKLGEFINTNASKSRDPGFWGGEPLWVTARKQGLRAGVHMWPGSEIDWAEGTPDYLSKYNGTEALDKKAAGVVEWLDVPSQVPEVMLAYVPTVDVAGHTSGVAGPPILAAIKQVDDFVGHILDGIKQRNLTDIVNIVVVSDHGMAPTSNKRIIFLDDYVPMDKVSNREGWPLAALRFEDESLPKKIYEQIREQIPRGFQAYLANDLPARWNFRPQGKYAQRMAPLYLVPDLGWAFVTHEEWNEMGKTYTLAGVHGYDNDLSLMQAFFVASGPAFPPGRYEPIRSIDVYGGVCRSVGLTPAPNDGRFRLQSLQKVYKEDYPGAPFAMDFLPGSTFEVFEPIK